MSKFEHCLNSPYAESIGSNNATRDYLSASVIMLTSLYPKERKFLFTTTYCVFNVVNLFL